MVPRQSKHCCVLQSSRNITLFSPFYLKQVPYSHIFSFIPSSCQPIWQCLCSFCISTPLISLCHSCSHFLCSAHTPISNSCQILVSLSPCIRHSGQTPSFLAPYSSQGPFSSFHNPLPFILSPRSMSKPLFISLCKARTLTH